MKATGDVTKLPKWAQEYIRDIARERDEAVRLLDEYTDNQSEAPFYYDDLQTTDTPPVMRRKYVQTRRMSVRHGGVVLDILLRDGQIDISYGAGDETYMAFGAAALVPSGFQQFRLSTLDNAWPKR